MIKDKLNNIGRYSINEYFEIFKSMVKGSTNYPENLETPLKAIPLNYEVRELDLTKFENHEKHIDIHYIIEGSERIGINTTDKLDSNIPYNEEGDYQLFDGEVREFLLLEKGDFLILFPGEAHVTAGKYKSLTVTKMVYKIPN